MEYFLQKPKKQKAKNKKNCSIISINLIFITTYYPTFLIFYLIITLFVKMAICFILTCCITYFSNTDINFYSTHFTLSWWSCFITCWCSNFSNICNFLIYTNEILILLLSLIVFYWFYKRLGSVQQTTTLS